VSCAKGGRRLVSLVSSFSYSVAMWWKGFVFFGSLHEAVCSHLQVLYETVCNPQSYHPAVTNIRVHYLAK
jgi:hypothetical protein